LLGGVGLVSLASLVVWRGGSLDGDLALRLPRCLMSFALGAATWAWCRNRPPLATMRAGWGQLLIGGAMLLMLSAAGRQPHLTLLMPLLSAALIAVMVRDPGSAARRLLERPVPQWLGRCSYSLYLVHMPLFRCLILATPGGWPDKPWAANFWVVMALAVLFLISGLTQAWIERPWREFGRRLANSARWTSPARPRSA